MICYHGTTRTFFKFDINKAYKGSFFGRGFYFSTHINDSITYYGSGDAPDNICKIDMLVDEYFDFESDDNYEAAKAAAYAEVVGNEPQVLICQLLYTNPINMYMGGGDYVELYMSDDDDDFESPVYDYLHSEGLEELWYSLTEDSIINVYDLYHKVCAYGECLDDYTDAYSIFTEILNVLGYDAVIQHDPSTFFNMPNAGDAHIFLWESDKIRILERITL